MGGYLADNKVPCYKLAYRSQNARHGAEDWSTGQALACGRAQVGELVTGQRYAEGPARDRSAVRAERTAVYC